MNRPAWVLPPAHIPRAFARLGDGTGIIDHTKGTAYTYPTWVQLVFGQTLVFDGSAEKEGQPVPGTHPVATAK